MKSIDIVSKIVAREGEAKASPSKGIQSINLSDYLLKSVWDKVFEVRTDSQGTEYIFGKLPMVTQYGITMYSGDGVDVPSLASGLPFDGRTIWYNPDTQQIEVIGGSGGGSGEGVSNFWDLSGIPSWITNSKPKYTYSEIEGTPDLTKYALASQIPSLSGYATESWVTKQNYATKATTLGGYGITDAYTKTNVDDLLKSYVTLGGTQTITGEKNFTGGLKVNDSLIYYDTDKKYWKLEGDLLVTGGVTMYGNEGTYTPSTIMDAISVDGTTISKEGGILKVIGGTGGGLDITALQNYLTQNSYLNVTSGDNRYLKLSGGTINSTFGGLEIKRNKAYASAIKYSNTSGVLGYIGFNDDFNPMLWNKSKGELGVILHSGNYSNYALPLSGGTLDGVLTIRASNSSSDSWIEFSNKSNSVVHKLGVRRPESSYGLQYYDGSEYYKIWHEGNDGSGSTLDADLLDGLHNGELTALVLSNYSGTWNYSLGNAGLSVFSDWNNTQSLSGYFYGISIESIDNRFRTVLATPLWIDGLHWRQYSDGGWQEDWRCLIDSYNIGSYNAGSATKLQTTRTIWGQSFDGTGNVSGELVLGSSCITGSQGINILDAKSSWVILGEGTNAKSWTTYINGYNINFRCGSGGTSGLYIDSTDRVGIGTTSPTKKLHIYDSNISNDSILLLEKGNAYDSRLELINSVDSLSIIQQSTGNAYISLRGNHSLIFETSNSARFTIDSSGNVGVGTITPSYKLDVNGDIATSQYLRVKAWSGYGSGICSMWYNGNTTQLVLDSGASLGYNLDVNGTISANSSNAMSLKLNSSKTDWGFAYNGIGIYHSDSQKGGFGWNSEPAGLSNVGLYFKNYVSGDCISLFNEGGICFIGGNVGIGTANPLYKYHVVGDSYIQGVSYVANYISFDYKDHSINNESAGRLGTFDRRGGMVLQFGTNTSYRRFSIIDQPWTVELFYVDDSGNVFANGGITMYSDQRKKTILNHVELSLKQIANAPLIEHYYNSDDKKTTHVGSIAQYWASMNDWFCKLDSEGFYTMEIQNAALASAISIARELDRYETKTDKAIKKLKERIRELEEEVEQLKAS